jgi:hypothetical protein
LVILECSSQSIWMCPESCGKRKMA